MNQRLQGLVYSRGVLYHGRIVHTAQGVFQCRQVLYHDHFPADSWPCTTTSVHVFAPGPVRASASRAGVIRPHITCNSVWPTTSPHCPCVVRARHVDFALTGLRLSPLQFSLRTATGTRERGSFHRVMPQIQDVRIFINMRVIRRISWFSTYFSRRQRVRFLPPSAFSYNATLGQINVTVTPYHTSPS